MPRILTLASLLLVFLLLPLAEAKADQIVLNPIQQGWYKNNGENNGTGGATPQFNNIFVGALSGTENRNYFVFNLTYVTAITSAQLRISRYTDTDLDTDPFETYVLYDVQTSADSLGTATGVPIFNDLGSGTVFGSVDVPTPNRFFTPGAFVSIDLNADALAAMQSTPGLFAIGGAISTLRFPLVPLDHEGLFAFVESPVVQLIVEGQQVPVPEPGTIILLASGLAGAAMRIARRSKAIRELNR